MLRIATVFCAILFFYTHPASALGPHEIALLINTNSPQSVELARHYAALRNVPPENLIPLGLPASVLEPSAQISRDDFLRTIWEPTEQALRERRIEDHILAWIYSSDFPVAVMSDPPVSLHGLTFVRNQLPESGSISNGSVISRLYAGPGRDLKQRAAPRSLENYAVTLGSNMPLPSMSLAHLGVRGESLDQAISRLETSARLNGQPPAGKVFFLTSEDVRTTCRSWQFEDAVTELKSVGQIGQILPLAEATHTSQAWGLMAGIAKLDTGALPQLVPGSIAEHLTSFAAVFPQVVQTTCTEWLLAGAAGSAGTVTEPLSIWTKFPTARVFVHYASGCTLLESFAQSVVCPLQLALFGDPLLAPWAKPQGLTLVSLADGSGSVSGTAEFAASTWAGLNDRSSAIFYLLDGRSVLASGRPPLLRVNSAQLADGYHELRAVVYGGGTVRHQGLATLGFIAINHGYSITVSGLSTNQILTPGKPLTLNVEATPPPRELALIRYESVVDRQPWTEGGVYSLDPSALGAGPISVQIAAIYENGEVVRSAPIRVRAQRAAAQ